MRLDVSERLHEPSARARLAQTSGRRGLRCRTRPLSHPAHHQARCQLSPGSISFKLREQLRTSAHHRRLFPSALHEHERKTSAYRTPLIPGQRLKKAGALEQRLRPSALAGSICKRSNKGGAVHCLAEPIQALRPWAAGSLAFHLPCARGARGRVRLQHEFRHHRL